jgi:very-short-patch-repair endonuclease
MPTELPRECLRILHEQDGVISVRQATAAGMPPTAIRALVRAGRWRAMQRGVYAAFTGKPTRAGELWAVVLRAGADEAVLSHQTAAELWGLIDGPSPVIHVAVPHGHNPERSGPIPGVAIHRSRSIERARHPARRPPCTRVEETVLDLVDCARSFDEAYAWICRAIGRRRTTAPLIRAALRERARIHWRRDIELALGDAEGGALSVLELRYVTGVERRHGLPKATRQARVRQTTGNRYLDNLYPEYRACVEIDGTAAHPEDEQWRDKNRDRWNAVHEGIETIRVGVPDLLNQERQCRIAADVAKWLSSRGPKVGRPCGPGCPVRLSEVLHAKYDPKVHPVTGGRDRWGWRDWGRGRGGAGRGG